MNTNVRMTELNGWVAQSHSAHEITCLRGMTLPSCRSSPTARMAPVFAVTGTLMGVVPPTSLSGVLSVMDEG